MTVSLSEIVVVGMQRRGEGEIVWLNDYQFQYLLEQETVNRYGLVPEGEYSGYVPFFTEMINGRVEDRDGDIIRDFATAQHFLVDSWTFSEFNAPTRELSGRGNVLFFVPGDMIPPVNLKKIFTRHEPVGMNGITTSADQALAETASTKRPLWLL